MGYDEMITAIGNGDMQALELLYDALYTDVFAFICSIVRNPSLASDLSQDTFIKVYQNAGNFRVQGNGKAWIIRIAKNLALNELKRMGKEQGEIPVLPYEDQQELISLRHSLSGLTTREREIVMLKAYGYSHKEIASIVRMPAGTVRWKYTVAINKMKVEMA